MTEKREIMKKTLTRTEFKDVKFIIINIANLQITFTNRKYTLGVNDIIESTWINGKLIEVHKYDDIGDALEFVNNYFNAGVKVNIFKNMNENLNARKITTRKNTRRKSCRY